MNPEKRRLIQQKLQEFLSLSPEEKHAIDENPQYDGLFCILQEMSDVVESSHEYEIFMRENNDISFLPVNIDTGNSHNIVYSPTSDTEEEYTDNDLSQHIDEDYEYSWAA